MASEIVADRSQNLAELRKLLSEVGSMCLAIGNVADQQPQDPAMAGALFAIQACAEKQDRLLARVDEQVEKLAAEVSHV